MKKFVRLLAALMCVCMLFTSCAPTSLGSGGTGDPKVQNLEKLCKVWGYTKYTHSAFVLGEKDWDEELLNLIPTVSEAKPKEVNGILHDWVVSLGEIDYKTSRKMKLPSEDELVVQADKSWINKDYLGKDLCEDLSQFKEVPTINSKSPMSVDGQSNPKVDIIRMCPTFVNEKTYNDMDYNDSSYCLLGLFRMWNAMEYYTPVLNVIDENWHELLPEYIEKMLSEPGQRNYELTLAMLSAKLQDAHINFLDYNLDRVASFKEEIGSYSAPIMIMNAEGKIVVWQVLDEKCPLQKGDIIIKLEEESIEDRIEYCKQYVPVTTDDKIVNMLSPFLLCSNNENFEISVLRDGKEETFLVQGILGYVPTFAYAHTSHEIIEDNIGLINPYALGKNEIFSIMQEFKNTDGLIIDLRQYPQADPRGDSIPADLAEYFVEEPQTFLIKAYATNAIPGVFAKSKNSSGGITAQRKAEGIYYYDKNVVILIDEKTQSMAEQTTMAVRNGEKVTVMGENSIGTLGDIRSLPLPGGYQLIFSGVGVYTPDGKTLQRVGVTPDIEVRPTVEGIKEGRDELMEAAVAYIQEQK